VIDGPVPVTKHLRLRGEVESEIFKSGFQPVGHHQISDDREIALMSGEGNALRNRRKNFDGGSRRSLQS
jgi:hypothetical protein